MRHPRGDGNHNFLLDRIDDDFGDDNDDDDKNYGIGDNES